MNNFKYLKINEVYDKDVDIINFYNSVLECTTIYDRVSAYFSSGFYKYISKGLTSLLKNNGKMRLILSDQIDEKTYDEILNGYKLRETTTSFIEKCIINSNFNIDAIKDEISILSFLIAINKLDIKFVFREKGLYHDKFALMYDGNGNELLLSGSNNETEASIAANHESFQTTINWDNPSLRELNTINIRKNTFEKLWNNVADNCIVLPLTEGLRWKFIKKINGDELAKHGITNKIARLSLDSNGCLQLRSNFDLSIIKDKITDLDILRMFISHTSNNVMNFKNLKMIKDLQTIIDMIKKLCSDNSIICSLNEELEEYLQNKVLKLDELAILGKKIKNYDLLIKDNDFILFRDFLQAKVKRPLKEPQLQAAYHISKLKRTMNFSVPGSGKTASVIGAFEYLNSWSKVDKIIVFGPLNCFKSWKDEFKNVSLVYGDNPNLVIDINTLDPTLVETYFKHQFEKSKLILINYEIIPKVAHVLQKYINLRCLIVFDEIHRLKNFESAKVPFVSAAIEKSIYRIALTGTPLPNGYIDLFVMFSILFGDYTQSYFGMNIQLLRKYDDDFKNKGIENGRLNSLIYPFYVRTNKHELKIPPAEPDILIKVETTDVEKFLYHQITDLKISSLEKIIRLSQVSCLPDIAGQKQNVVGPFFDEFINNSCIEHCKNIDRNNFSSSKLARLCSEISKIDGKCIVWCQFVETIERVNAFLSKNGIVCSKIYGSVAAEERTSIIDSFIEDPKVKVLITNPHTLAESVSLHKSCHHAFYIELNYNLAHFLQSRDRIHRLGLKSNEKTYYHILLNYYDDLSIDYLIYKSLLNKEKKMRNAIDSGSLLITDKIFNLNKIDINDFEKTHSK